MRTSLGALLGQPLPGRCPCRCPAARILTVDEAFVLVRVYTIVAQRVQMTPATLENVTLADTFLTVPCAHMAGAFGARAANERTRLVFGCTR